MTKARGLPLRLELRVGGRRCSGLVIGAAGDELRVRLSRRDVHCTICRLDAFAVRRGKRREGIATRFRRLREEAAVTANAPLVVLQVHPGVAAALEDRR